MAAGHLDLTVFGVRWSVDTSEANPDAHDLLERLWSRAHTALGTDSADSLSEEQGGAPDGDAEDFVVTAGPLGDRLGVRLPDDLEAFPYDFSRAVTLASINRRVGSCLMLHAAGLAVPSGATSVLVAASGTGKTTASRILGQSLGYLSDETVVIEPDFSISPYPKPLSVIVDPERPEHKQEMSPDELGLRPAPPTPHLGAVIVLDRDKEFPEPELTAEPLIHALVDLIPQTSGLALLDNPLDTLTRAVATNGGPYRLRYADIAEAAGLVTDLLAACDSPGGPGVEPVRWIHHPGVDAPEAPALLHPYEVTEETTFRRAPWRDAIESENDGDLLVLLDTVPAHLSGIGALLWRRAAEPITVARAHDLAVAELGDHPEAMTLVREGVDALLAGGVLEKLD